MEGTDPKGRCNYCFVYVGRDKVKTCSRCRLVRYCSKECQVAAWRTYKSRCTSSLRESLAKDPVANALNTALSKWINNWRLALHNWAIWAMDLAKTVWPPTGNDYSFVIELERRPNPPNQSLYFQMRGGDIMTRDHFLTRLRALNVLSNGIVASVNERRTNDTAQIIVKCEDLDPAVSRALAQDWQRDLIEAMDTGQPALSRMHGLKAVSRV